MADYVLEGPRWGNGPPGTGGGVVSWALDSTVPAYFQPVVQAAFADWSANSNIQFEQVASVAGADISFSDANIDGPNGAVGVTNYSFDPSANAFIDAAITFDSSEGWHVSGNTIADDDGGLFPVALHEIGHAIGLGHYTVGPAIMNPVVGVSDLTTSDLDGVHALYGLPGSPAAATGGGDNLAGSDGPDLVSLLAGDDTYQGGLGDDTVSGNEGNDLIYGNAGNDQLFGNTGNDTLYGGPGSDYVRGGKDDDAVFGDRDNDLVYGDLGNDVLHGGKGDDTVYGGKGDDILFGDLGNDMLIGGLGADAYVFGQNSGADLVEGFNPSEGDRLDVQGQSYTVGSAPDGTALIALSGGGTIELAGVAHDQVNASFFSSSPA